MDALTIKQLAEKFAELAAHSPNAKVTFGLNTQPVCGGVLGKTEDGWTVNLAPIKLDQMPGGF